MYKIQPIVTKEQIQAPSCMYSMKSIYDDSQTNANNMPGVSHKSSYKLRDISQQISTFLKDQGNNDVAEVIEIRQQNILQELEYLKEKLLCMRKKIVDDSKSTQAPVVNSNNNLKDCSIVPAVPINVDLLQDIVVNANPFNIPYSLLALKSLWKNQLNLLIKCYTHSTVAEIPEEAKQFAERFTNNKHSLKLPNIMITLIWKKVNNTEMILSDTPFIPISGEVNIIRYLSRTGPVEYSYETVLNECYELDTLLDSCYQLINAETVKDRQNILRILNDKLGKQQFYGGNKIGIGDVAVSSTIKQSLAIKNDCSQNMSKWLQRVSPILGY